MELDTQIVVAVALNILWNDKLSVVDTVVGIALNSGGGSMIFPFSDPPIILIIYIFKCVLQP